MPGPSAQPDTPGTSPVDFATKIRSFAGLLVAAFAGVLNFIGLKSGELSAVLRNQAHWPTLVLALIIAGILTSVASIFVTPGWTVTKWVWLAAIGVLVILICLPIVLIRIPSVTSTAEVVVGIVVASAGAAFTILCVALLRRVPESDRRPRGGVSVQGLLVFVSITLTAVATYAALRLETVSQLDSTAAQLSADISESPAHASVVLSIDASKMANADRVYVRVTGLRRGTTIGAFCGSTRADGTLTCAEAPCFVKPHSLRGPPSGCDVVSSGVYQPNADGSVQQTMTFPVSTAAYQRVELLGEVCKVTIEGRPCVYDLSHLTRVDLQLP
jgi:hypothetical protein